MLPAKEQLEIIQKGAHHIVNEGELLLKLEQSVRESRPLIIKLGLDPSAPDIHLGHAVVLRKIKQMQDLGHKAAIIIGDFTGRIGDPSGKSKTRSALTQTQVMENAQTYFTQIFKILDRDKTEVRYNSEWLSQLNFEDVLTIASTTTVARMMERDDFLNRFQNQIPIGLHEFFYPLMQAYDSVALKSDIELGGTDQTFNILMGRTLQKHFGMSQQTAIFMPLLEGLDGTEKMSKSLGNYIGIDEPAEIMFKKVMEIPDFLIIKYFKLATDERPATIAALKSALDHGENPRNIKYQLAKTITGLYHSPEDAALAVDYFDKAFARKEIPDNIPQLVIGGGTTLKAVVPMLVNNSFVQSRSEFMRLVKQKGVRLNGEPLSIQSLDHVLSPGDVLKIGKKRFVRFSVAPLP